MDFFANPYLKEKIWYDPLPRNIAELNVRIVACIKGIPEEFLINAWILCSVLFRSGAGVWLGANRRIARKSLGWSRARGLGIRR